MGFCSITQVTNPSSSSSYTTGDTVTITWNRSSQFSCSTWNVTQVKLQSNISGSWSDVTTLFNGTDSVNSQSLNVTLPSSISSGYGDYFRFKITYEEEDFIP